MTFAAKLRELRLAKEWSQKELAQRTGFAQSAVARWEAGKQIPAFDSVQALCAALGVRCTVFDGCDYQADEEARAPGRPKVKPDAKAGKKKGRAAK